MGVLTMSSWEIRQRRKDMRVVLWGSDHWRHFGSPADLRRAAIERERWQRMVRAQRVTAGIVKAAQASSAQISAAFRQMGRELGKASEQNRRLAVARREARSG